MYFDINNPLLKNSISENRLAYKSIDSSIDDRVVSGTSQKSLSMELRKESNHFLKDKNKQKDKDQKIVRDPLKLLNLL